MKSVSFFSPALLAVALSPVFLQSGTCSPKSGNPNLVSLEIEAGGLDRLVGFDTNTLTYGVWFDGAATFTVRATAEDPNTAIGVWMPSGYVLLGNGSGESTLGTPAVGTIIVVESKSSGGVYKRFEVTIDPPCTAGECNDNDPNTFDACIASVCQFGGAPTATIPMACAQNVSVEYFRADFDLSVAPLGDVIAGQSFDVEISGSADVNWYFHFWNIAYTGLPTRVGVAGTTNVSVRSGATGADVTLGLDPSVPYTCNLDINGMTGLGAGPYPPCDPANNTTSDVISPNTDCVGLTGPSANNPCLQFVDLVVIDSTMDDCASCAALDIPGTTLLEDGCGPGSYHAGYCWTSDPIPLAAVSATFEAEPGNEVLFGFRDEPFPPPIQPQSVPFGEGLSFFIDVLHLANICYMGAVDGYYSTTYSLLPDSALLSIPITCLVDADCDDGNACTLDICDPVGCLNVPNDPLPSSCGVNGECTVEGACECTPVGWSACDDGTVCTVDTCDPYSGCGTSLAPAGTDCTAEFGVLAECDGNGDCIPACLTDTDCDDGNECTLDVCDAVQGCLNIPYDPAINPVPPPPSCGINGECTELGTCQCTPAGWSACEDGTVCTVDTCDPYSGCGTSLAPEGTDCSAESPPFAQCDGSGQCVPVNCLANGDCTDGNDCTLDLCCDLPENQTICGPLQGCQSGQYPPPGPPPCTTPSGLSGTCDGNLMCVCDPSQCVDGNDCTLDSCDPLLGCDFPPAPPGTQCFDYLPVFGQCDGSGFCAPAGCLSDFDCPPGFTCNTGAGGVCE